MDCVSMGVDTTKVIAVDFDGTLTVADEYPKPTTSIRSDAADMIRALQDAGCWVCLWTCREGAKLDEALEMCRAAGIEFDSVNAGNGKRGTSTKINADIYVDDRSVCSLSDAVEAITNERNQDV